MLKSQQPSPDAAPAVLPPSECSAWFSYDPDDGFYYHGTEDEARKAAERNMEAALDMAQDDEWSEEVQLICWGKVIQRATPVPAPPGFENYELKPNPKLRDAAPTQPTDDRQNRLPCKNGGK